MNKLTVTLKQHTPLIHFQHNQEGATLRASEVKPKLDKFILTKLGEGDYEKGKGLAKKWLIGNGEHPALDYKMRIIADDSSRKELMLVSKNTPFFAQEKQNLEIERGLLSLDSIPKKGIIHQNIVLEIRTRNSALIEQISACIQAFFIVNNFGTRQSKGFGCFEVIQIYSGSESKKLENKEVILKDNFPFVYKKVVRRDLTTILQTINKDYKSLKSGLSRGDYSKSKLMLYGRSKNILWEKRFIKQSFDNEDNIYKLKCEFENRKEEYVTNQVDDFKYLRCMLGYAEQMEFLLENPPMGKKSNKMIVNLKHGEIRRFKSPILFKIFDNTIYLVGSDVEKGILNQEFTLSVSIQGDDRNKYKEMKLATPDKFSLTDFIRFAMTDKRGDQLDYSQLK